MEPAGSGEEFINSLNQPQLLHQSRAACGGDEVGTTAKSPQTLHASNEAMP
jgi:hypothetical protein